MLNRVTVTAIMTDDCIISQSKSPAVSPLAVITLRLTSPALISCVSNDISKVA